MGQHSSRVSVATRNTEGHKEPGHATIEAARAEAGAKDPLSASDGAAAPHRGFFKILCGGAHPSRDGADCRPERSQEAQLTEDTYDPPRTEGVAAPHDDWIPWLRE